MHKSDSMDTERFIVLGDGTILDNSYCCYSGNKGLWCFITGKTMLECAKLFSDQYKTSNLTCYYYSKRHIYKGFTDLLVVQKSLDGVDVRLTWPEDKPHSIEEIDEEVDPS